MNSASPAASSSATLPRVCASSSARASAASSSSSRPCVAGIGQQRCRGPRRPRQRSDRRRWRSCADTTQPLGRARRAGSASSELVVHDQRPGGEARTLEEVLRGAGAGQRVRVDADAAAPRCRTSTMSSAIDSPTPTDRASRSTNRSPITPRRVPSRSVSISTVPKPTIVAVDRAHHDRRVVACRAATASVASCGSGRASRVVHSAPPRWSRISARSAACQLDEDREVGRARPLERAPRGRAIRRAVRSCRESCGAGGASSRTRAPRRARRARAR